MTTPEGDELLALIRQFVKERGVPPQAQEPVTEIVAKVVVTVMSEPRFYSNLAVVQQMQSKIIQLEHALSQYAQKLAQGSPAARPPKPVKQAAKKMPVKRVAKKPPLPYNVRAFKKGAAGH